MEPSSKNQRKSDKLSFRLMLASAFILAGLFGSTVAVFTSSIKTRELLGVYSRKQHIERIYDRIRDAERAQRGYLLTNDPSYLQLFNENQQALIEFESTSLNRLTFHKFEEMKRTISLMERGKRDEAIELVMTNEGIRYMSSIEAEKNDQLGKLEVEEKNLLTMTNRMHTLAILGSAMMSLFTTGLLLYALSRFNKGPS